MIHIYIYAYSDSISIVFFIYSIVQYLIYKSWMYIVYFLHPTAHRYYYIILVLYCFFMSYIAVCMPHAATGCLHLP